MPAAARTVIGIAAAALLAGCACLTRSREAPEVALPGGSGQGARACRAGLRRDAGGENSQ